ncbi:MAG: sterol desaturase family protein [Cytophagales bacterium]|nr:sterol desaturase family protein [Cytophagales bacterium]
MTVEQILPYTTAILFTWIICIIILERYYPFRKGLKILREGFWIDLVWYTIIQSYFLKIIIFEWIIYPIDMTYHITSWNLISHWPLWCQLLFFLFTHDLYIYWFHRWQHHNKILWRTHEAHHSGKEVDWLSGSRSHVLEIIINQTIEFAPIILLGADPLVVPLKAMLDAMFGTWIHANLRFRLGWLGYIINTPVAHQWHHADDKIVFYANYATKFAFWDHLFGTAVTPDRLPDKWGLPYDYPRDYFVQHAFSFKRFDEKKLLQYPWFDWYYDIRLKIIRYFFDKK